MFKIKPHKLLLISWLLWLLFFVLSPYDYYNIIPYAPAILILLFYNILFYLGLKTRPLKMINPEKRTFLNLKKLKKLFWFSIILGAIGCFLSTYAKFKIITVLNISDPFGNRAQLMDAGEVSGGLIGVISAILYPFSYVGLLIAIYFSSFFKKWQLLCGLLVGLYPPIFTFLIGGRFMGFFYIIILILVLFVKYSFRDFVGNNVISEKSFYNIKVFNINFFSIPKQILKKRILVTIILLVSVSLYAFSFIQKNRTDSWNIDNQDSFENSSINQEWVYNHHHAINYLLSDKPYENNGILGFIHYQVHGVFEFIRLVNHVDNFQGIYYGKYEFYVFVKFFGFMGIDIGDDFNTMTEKTFYKPAVYTTFWGPVYVDFGILGGAIFFLIGFLIRLVYINALRGSFLGLFFYPFIGAILISVSVINAFIGQPTYFLIAIITSWFLYKYIL